MDHKEINPPKNIKTANTFSSVCIEIIIPANINPNPNIALIIIAVAYNISTSLSMIETQFYIHERLNHNKHNMERLF